MKTFIVQLETHDDVISARDKISWAKARRVLLVWPRRGSVLERPVDLLVLARHAKQNGAQMAVVTRSPKVKTYAAELGIPVFKSAAQAQGIVWRRPRGSLRSPAGFETPEYTPPDAAELREQARALAQPDPFDARMQNRWLRIAAFLVGIAAFFALAMFFAPGAKVTLAPERITQSLVIPARADLTTRSAAASGSLPVEVVTVVVEGRDQAPATGTARIADAAATGEVLLTNLTDQPVTIPTGTVAVSGGVSPVRFEITESGTIPAGVGQTDTVSVRALTPGSRGNVSAGQIRGLEGPLGLRLTVENPTPTRGGLDRSAPSPNASDYNVLREKLTAALEANAMDELSGQIGADRRLIEGSLRLVEVLEETRQPEAGQPSDILQLSMRAEYEVWTVREQDLQAAAAAALNAVLEEDYTPVPGTLRIDFTSSPRWQGGSNRSASWDLRVEREAVAHLSEEQVIEAVRGRGAEDAIRRLNSLPLAAPPLIQMTPTWWKMVPFLPFRIAVVVT